MKRLRRLPFLLLLPALFIWGACEDSDEPSDLARLDRMESEIVDFIGEPTCTDSTQCRSIAFGAKPCGGPWKYLIYSTTTVDSVALHDWVTEYNELNEEMNRRHGWMSDCMFVGPPVLGCRDGACAELERKP